MEEIDFIFEPDGSMVVEAKHIKGSDCEVLTREIEKAVGVTASKKRTREYYETPKIRRKVNN